MDEVYEIILLELSVKLNEIHQVRHSVRYWRIVVGAWLYYFCQVLFDRWMVIRQASDRYPRSVMYSDASASSQPAASSLEFLRESESDAWNSRIFAELAARWTSIDVVRVPHSGSIGEPVVREIPGTTNRGSLHWLRFTVVRGLRRISALQPFRPARVAMQADYLQTWPRVWLNLLLLQVPTSSEKVAASEHTVLAENRAWSLAGGHQDEFVIAAGELVARYIPVVFLEGYRAASSEALERFGVKVPRVIMTANAFDSDDLWKLWAAGKVEEGSKLVIAQHGGHYGVGAWSAMQRYETSICDRWLSWGWGHPHQSKVVPAPATKLVGLPKVRSTANGTCVLVAAALPRQSYWLYSAPVGPQFASYFEDQFAFVSALDRTVQDELVVRLYHRDYGWDQAERWEANHPRIRLDPGTGNLDELLATARLYVSTYNATTYLEAMRRNLPTVMFWNPKMWELSSCVASDFDRLREAGILFDTPEECALHINRIWNQVPVWWRSTVVQSAVSAFTERYAYVGTKPLRELRRVLTNL